MLQDWKAKSRYAVLIAGLPAHGLKYHNSEYDDNMPRRNPSGLDSECKLWNLLSEESISMALKLSEIASIK